MSDRSPHYALGVELYQKGQLAEALESFRLHVAAAPNDFQGHICAGVVLEALQRTEEALGYYLEAVRLHPDPVYHHTVGCVLRKLRHQGREEEEARQYQEATRLRPGYAEAWCSLASLRLTQGRYDEVLKVCQQGLKQVPQDARLCHSAALAYFFTGSDVRAREFLDRSNQLAAVQWDGQLDGSPRNRVRRWFVAPPAITELLAETAGQAYGLERPRVLGSCPWALPSLRYRQQRVFRVNLRNVYLEGVLGYVYDNDAVYANESVWLQGVWRLFHEAPRKHPRTTTTVVRLASLHQPNWENYYHWMAECLVRLVLLKDVMETDPDIRLLAPAIGAPRFVHESLELLGLDETRLIRDRSSPQHRYYALELVYVDWSPPLSTLPAKELAALWYPPREALLRLRRTLAEPHPSPEECNNVVYLTREYPHQQRGVANEAALVDALRQSAGERLVLFTGKEPLRQQIDIFRRARLVIGAHGAGLVNILFCRPGTPVVEFPVVPMRLNHFGHLCAALSLDYWIVPSVSAQYQGHYTIDSHNLADILTVIHHVLGLSR